MTTRELKRHLPELHDRRMDEGWSDAALAAHARILTALRNLVVLNGLDDEFGDREMYRAKLETLYGLLRRRYACRTSFAARAAILDAMTTVAGDNGCIIDGERRAADERLADELVSSYLGGFDENRCDPEEFFAVMRLLLICMYGVVEEEDGEAHPWMTFIRKKFAVWAEELDKDGCWQGISDTEALRRLVLLDMNSCLFVDESHDGEIRQGYAYYCAGRDLPDNVSAPLSPDRLRGYALQYELIRQGSFNQWEHAGRLDRIAGLLEKQTVLLPPESDAALYCRSLVIENCCRNVSREYQKQLCGMLEL